MKAKILLIFWLACAFAPSVVRADELDDLVKQLAPPARFAGYEPDFRVIERTFIFHGPRGPEEKNWWLVMDGDKYVAIVRSGDFNLLALTPDQAKTTLSITTGRYNLDTQLGPTLCTHQFLKPVKVHGSIYGATSIGPQDEWIGGGKSITLVRRMTTEGRVTSHRFVIRVDGVLGYCIDGHYDVRFRRQPQDEKWVAPTFCPGCFVPWPEHRVYDRTVHCPAGGGYRGWANNLLCMDRCDSDKSKSTWRDGGFIAFLNAKTGWSVCRTRQDGCGNSFNMPVCNAHNDFHVWIPVPANLPKTKDGWFHFRAHHRLLGMPPEITRYVWDQMELIQQGRTGVFVYIGEPCDFEDQPRRLTDPVRGLCWTGGGPKVSTDVARSGKKSLLLSGTSWPNLPQVICEPNSRYRIEAWLKVVPWTAEEKAAARKHDESRRAKLARAGKPLPPPVQWDRVAAEAYITAHWYDSSPHHKQWLFEQRTNKATGNEANWQRVELEFDTPEWNPFVNVVFVVSGCRAYLDDFSLMKIR